MSKKGIRLGVALLATASLGLAVPATAAPGVKSTLKIKDVTASGAKGTLSSKTARCEKRRKVALWVVAEYSPTRVGKTKTDKKGRWSVRARTEQGSFYFATAPGIQRGELKCKAAESRSVRYTKR